MPPFSDLQGSDLLSFQEHALFSLMFPSGIYYVFYFIPSLVSREADVPPPPYGKQATPSCFSPATGIIVFPEPRVPEL